MNLHETLRTAGLAAALSLAMAAPPALAQQAGAFSGERPYPFTDLPGVTTPEEKADEERSGLLAELRGHRAAAVGGIPAADVYLHSKRLHLQQPEPAAFARA